MSAALDLEAIIAELEAELAVIDDLRDRIRWLEDALEQVLETDDIVAAHCEAHRGLGESL